MNTVLQFYVCESPTTVRYRAGMQFLYGLQHKNCVLKVKCLRS
jgi:hypothetical protein